MRATNISECISTAIEICKLGPNVCNNGKCVVVNEYEFSCECFPGFLGKFFTKFQINIRVVLIDLTISLNFVDFIANSNSSLIAFPVVVYKGVEPNSCFNT